jgi:stage V sporulation protein G
MEITEVHVTLVHNRVDRLKAFCSITVDGQFVVRDIKVIEGAGGLFVAMPSRKVSVQCRRCGEKNHLRASYCNRCGTRLRAKGLHGSGRPKLYADIAHPIQAECREHIEERILREFHEELERSRKPDYRPIEAGEGDIEDPAY